MHILDRGRWSSGRAISAIGAHAGLAILALGIAFSGPYTTEKELMLARGQQESVGAYTVSLEKISDGSGNGFDFLRADLKISMDGKKIGELQPERRMYVKFGQMQFSEVDVISTLGQDIYASLLGMDEDYRVLVKISIEPLVNWIWAGGFIMCLVPAVGLFIGGRRKNAF